VKVSWIAAPGLTGQAIARGGQIDGPYALRFNGGLDENDYTGDWAFAPLLPKLHMLWQAPITTADSYVRLQASGCYAIQVDGPSYSEVLVFKAVMG
jgi:hypothetical protein